MANQTSPRNAILYKNNRIFRCQGIFDSIGRGITGNNRIDQVSDLPSFVGQVLRKSTEETILDD